LAALSNAIVPNEHSYVRGRSQSLSIGNRQACRLLDLAQLVADAGTVAPTQRRRTA
jgi:hypothetical protein